MKFGTLKLVQHAPGYKMVPQSFKFFSKGVLKTKGEREKKV